MPTRAPPDPGAAEIVGSIVSTLHELRQGEDGVTRIGLTALHNQSRATYEDFDVMRRGLMAQLTRAGRDFRVVFTDAEEIAVQYHLEGAAYRLEGDGSERWELFLHLLQDDDGLLVWEPAGTVRVSMRGSPPEAHLHVVR